MYSEFNHLNITVDDDGIATVLIPSPGQLEGNKPKSTKRLQQSGDILMTTIASESSS